MSKPRSLRQIMLAYGMACLVLVTAMGLLSGAGLLYWRQSAQESERINAALGEVREIRSPEFASLNQD